MSGVALADNAVHQQRMPPVDEATVSAGAAQSMYVGVIDFYRIIRRRLGIVVGTTALVTAVALYALMTSAPTYTSTATLMVRPIGAEESTPRSSAATADAENLRIATIAEMLQSRQLLMKAAKTLNLADDPEFAAEEQTKSLMAGLVGLFTSAPTKPTQMSENEAERAARRTRMEKLVDKLQDHVHVVRVGQSHLINVEAQSNEPMKSALIANRLLDTYMKEQLGDQRDSAEERHKTLTDQIDALRLKTEKFDRAVATYKRDNGLFTSKPYTINTDERVQLAGQLAAARAAAVESAVRSRYAPTPAAAAARSTQLDRLQADESTLTSKLAQLSTIYGKGHPEVQNTTAQLEATRAMMQAESARASSEAARIASSAAAETRGRLAAEAAAANAGVSAIAGQLGSVYARNGQEGLKAVGLRALEREAEVAEGQLIQALNDLRQLERKGEAKNGDAQILSQASLPLEPSHPQPKRMIGVAILGGSLLGIIMAFAIEALDSRIRTAEQVKRLLGVPTLALIPEFAPGRRAYEIVQNEPRSHYADAMRNLYIELNVRRPRGDRHVVLVTSPLNKEGKSTTASSLAAAAAAMGRHAIVVDLDLRKSQTIAANDEEPGLDIVAFLSGHAALDQIISEAGEPMSFASTRVGQAALDPAALIASPRLEMLMEHLSRHFQLIVINAPPILPVLDAKTLARAADQTVMVLRWGQTPLEAARLAMSLFEMPVTGVVLNAVNLRKHAARKYGDAVAYLPQLETYFSDEPNLAGRSSITRRLTSALEAGRARLIA
jgi:polysaccharide biosynthesis transport protein